jgi:nucleoside-diphosphate-sugar epimerase
VNTNKGIRVLCTGSNGYLGSELVKFLLTANYIETIYGFDACFFGDGPKDNSGKFFMQNKRVEDVEWDKVIYDMEPDVVVSLAALSNDPSCELDIALTKMINHFSVVKLAYACKKYNVPIIFASSASVYGAVDYAADVYHPAFPISVYAKEKLEAENDLWSLATDKWQPSIFRMATLYGVSDRFRLDLAVNKMFCDAIKTGKIVVNGGNQWRPFLSVTQAVTTYAYEILRRKKQSEIHESHGFTKNLGTFNAKISDLSTVIAEFTGATEEIRPDNLDSRNYRMAGLPDIYTHKGWLKHEFEQIAAYVDAIPDQEVMDDRYHTVRRLRKCLMS